MSHVRYIGIIAVTFPMYLCDAAPDCADYSIPRGLAPAVSGVNDLHSRLDDKQVGAGLRGTLLDVCGEWAALPMKPEPL